ncbi:SH3 domain-containing protein [Ideonella sp.]|uniref:SH3 domain-containing protein n=1 Tax=Ideonella sp. TaxID=1929293 RepID=UPI0035B1DC74
MTHLDRAQRHVVPRRCLGLALAAAACAAQAQTPPPSLPPGSLQEAAPATASVAPTAPSATQRVARVQVVGPYVDMRSGPGRGYPVFYAAEREEWLVIELRHTDWFKVRTPRGVSGWVSRAQMRHTVTEDGVPFDLADPTLQDYLNRRFDLGIGYGATAKTAFTRAWAGWRFSDTLSVDVNFADVARQTSSTTIWTASLLAEPWSDRRLSPFVGVGVGRFNHTPNESLVNNQPYDGNMGVLTLGARYHLSGRVSLRVDYSRYAVFVDDDDSRLYQAGTVGLSIHF